MHLVYERAPPSAPPELVKKTGKRHPRRCPYSHPITHTSMAQEYETLHKAVVQSVTPTQITVRMTQRSACLHCAAGKFCSAADSKERLISVPNKGNAEYHPGEVVALMGKPSVGLRAVWWAFGLPLILLLAVALVAALALGLQDHWVVLCSLGALVLYGFVLWLMRAKFATQYQLTIEKIQ